MALGTLFPRPAGSQGLSTANANRYEAAMERAKSARTHEETETAISDLHGLLPSYQQDVDLPLELGALLFRSRRYTDSLYIYKLALARSAAGGDAELGVAWSLAKLGRCAEAKDHFESVLANNPTVHSADEGLRVCAFLKSPVPQKLWMKPFVSQSIYLYENHPTIKYTLAPLVRIDALLFQRFYGAATYRYSYFAAQSAAIAPWSQHDVYLDAGYSGRSFGATLRYAWLRDDSGAIGTSHHVGLSARYSFFIDTLLNMSASFYRGSTVLRGELAAMIPIGWGLSFRPSAILQWTSDANYTALSLTAFYTPSFTRGRLSLWLGGKGGGEQRAALLDVAYVYIGTAKIPYGAWAGAVLRPGAGLALSLAYTYDRMVRTDVTNAQDSAAHSLTLGLSREF